MLAYLEAKLPPNSISWCLFLEIFMGGHAPRPPRRSMLCMLGLLCTPAALVTEHPQLEVPSSSHVRPPVLAILLETIERENFDIQQYRI